MVFRRLERAEDRLSVRRDGGAVLGQFSEVALDPVGAEVGHGDDALKVEQHVEVGGVRFSGERGGGVGEPGLRGESLGGGLVGDEGEGVGEEVLSRGEEEEAIRGGCKGYGALAGGAGSGAQIKGEARRAAEAPVGARLDEICLGGLGGGEAGDVEELEVADVVPGEDRLTAGDLRQQRGGGDA